MADEDSQIGKDFGVGQPTRPTSGSTKAGYVRRAQLSLAIGTYTAIPGQPSLGGGADHDEIGKAAINDADQAYLVPPLIIPQMAAGDGNVRAIAIASDSPIANADLWLGDVATPTRNRIGVGRAWVGDPGENDNVLVTLPRAIANPFDAGLGRDGATGETAAEWLAANFVFDTQTSLVVQSDVVGDDRVEVMTPLRLEIYRGDLTPLSQRRRAAYYADSFFSLLSDTTGSPYFRLWLCCDGRDETEIVVSSGDATNAMLISVDGYDPVLPIRGGGGTDNLLKRDVVITPITTDVLAAPTAGITGWKFLVTLPYQWISVTVQPNVVGTGIAPTPIFGAISMVTRDKE